MNQRALFVLMAHCLACSNASEASESDGQKARHERTGGIGGIPAPPEPPLELPTCGAISNPCVSEFTAPLESAEAWPVGRYIAENRPPVVEVHHDVVVKKCSYECPIGEPLAVPVRFLSAAESERDSGPADAGEGTLDAADAAL